MPITRSSAQHGAGGTRDSSETQGSLDQNQRGRNAGADELAAEAPHALRAREIDPFDGGTNKPLALYQEAGRIGAEAPLLLAQGRGRQDDTGAVSIDAPDTSVTAPSLTHHSFRNHTVATRKRPAVPVRIQRTRWLVTQRDESATPNDRDGRGLHPTEQNPVVPVRELPDP